MKMSFMNSWCERMCIFSLILLISIFIADYKFYFLPINGLWLLLYILCLIVTVIWLTCVYLQMLLRQSSPFEYKFEGGKIYQKLNHIFNKPLNLVNKSTKNDKISINGGSRTPKKDKIIPNIDSELLKTNISNINVPETKEKIKTKSIDERIEILVHDIEQKFISRWYSIISKEESFPAESKLLLEGVIRRVLQVSIQMDGSKIVCGALVILLKHLKEYRKAIKRAHKTGGSIESVYRYSHTALKSESSLEQICHRLTANVLREFISWELWNSLPCRLLVSILSKRFTKYILFYISQPGWLNYKIIYQTASPTERIKLNLDDHLYISLSDVDLADQTEPIKIKKNLSVEEIKEKRLQKSLSSTPQLSPKRDRNNFIADFKDDNNSKEKFSKLDSVIQIGSDSVIEQALTKMIMQQTAPILQRAEKSNTDLSNLETTVKTDKTNKPSTEEPDAAIKEALNDQKSSFTPLRSEPVKIHSAKSAGKRWDENNSELSNVSLGQDLLALEGLDSSGITGFSGRRLWGYSAELNENENEKWEMPETWLKEKECGEKEMIIIEEQSQNRLNMSPPKIERKKLKESLKKASPPSSIPHCLRPATTSASAFVTNTIKPIAGNVTATTLHNMRELQQSTVNNVVKPVSHATEKAIHRIGDLQDEAVGVVEGIFDFGMAGLRKGLRLTGLQDINEMGSIPKPAKTQNSNNNETMKQSPKNAPKLVKLGHVTSASEDAKPLIKNITVENSESCWVNPIAKESPNGFENQMLLEKSPSVPENPEVPVIEPVTEVPGITESNLFLTDSPEYEETADLASTISKLRSLLQQKSSESSLNTPAVSPMQIDDKSCPTPTEPTITDAIRGDGGMQRFARTVTGMFNTFKTALPGNSEQLQIKGDQQWIFVENETSDTDLASLLNSLLVERRDYCTIDTAYEAMDSLEVLTESVNSQIGKISWDSQSFEDELDDLDGTIPITKALVDVICECLQDTKCALNQEPVMKALLILGGAKLENNLSYFAEKSLRLINKAIGPLPKNLQDDVLAMNLEEMVNIIQNAFPFYLKEMFGHKDLTAGLKFFISSLQSVKINQDITLQFFELICSQLIYASSQMSPTPSA